MAKRKKINKYKNKKTMIILVSSFVFLSLSVLLCFNVLFLRNHSHLSSRINNLKNYNGFGEGFSTAGWVNIPGTNIDYPIVYSNDDALDFDETRHDYGWISYTGAKKKDMVFINGHNIFNLSSNPLRSSNDFYGFEELMNYVYYDFAKDNQYFQYTIDGVDYTYKIFGVEFINAIDLNYFYNDGDIYDSLKEEFIEYVLENSFYNYDVDVSLDDDLISLVTCSRFLQEENGTDFVVVGRRVRENEKIDDYKVVTNNDVYNKIKKIMKGDDTNE